MEKYKSLYAWMLIPMMLMQLGIFKDYWGDFSDNAWSVHVHYWTGTVWYLYLIVQPYLATHGKLARHRTNGMVGLFVAGGVCLTAFSMMSRDLVNAQRSLVNVDRFGPFQPWFFYGVAVVEIVMMTAFAIAIIMSIIHRKKLEDHAWWLISTVFIIMMPALGRGFQFVFIGMQMDKWPHVDIMPPLYYAEITIAVFLLLGAWKYKKLTHPATYLALAVNLFNSFLAPIGHSESIQELLKAMIKE